MSKQLAKLLSICALVVLLPFIVIGTALTFTEAVAVTLSIAQTGLDGTYTSAREVGIFIDGQKQADTIEVKKNKTVELSFQGEGYYFYGWYEGEAGSIDKTKSEGKISSEEKINYVVSSNKTVTAVRDVQKYDITYEGTNFDGTALTTTSQEGVEYGARLPELDGGTQLFRGWKLKGTNDEPLFVAQFEADEAVESVVLEPVWKTDFSFPVYFNINDESASNTVSLTYNVTSGVISYSNTRENFTFAGLKVEGVDQVFSEYTTQNGYSDYKTKSGDSMYETLKYNPTAKVYAVWESIYSPFIFNYQATAYYKDPTIQQNGYWFVYNDKDNNGILEKSEAYQNDTLKEYVFSDETGIAIEDNMMDFVLGDTTNLVTRATDSNGNLVPGQKVKFADKIVVSVAGVYGYRIDILLDDTFTGTFQDIIDTVVWGLEDEGLNIGIDQLDTLEFEVDFIFEVVA